MLPGAAFIDEPSANQLVDFHACMYAFFYFNDAAHPARAALTDKMFPIGDKSIALMKRVMRATIVPNECGAHPCPARLRRAWSRA